MITIFNTNNFSILRIEQPATKKRQPEYICSTCSINKNECISIEAITTVIHYTYVSPCSPSAVFCNSKVITCSMKPHLKTHLLKVSASVQVSDVKNISFNYKKTNYRTGDNFIIKKISLT